MPDNARYKKTHKTHIHARAHAQQELSAFLRLGGASEQGDRRPPPNATHDKLIKGTFTLGTRVATYRGYLRLACFDVSIATKARLKRYSHQKNSVILAAAAGFTFVPLALFSSSAVFPALVTNPFAEEPCSSSALGGRSTWTVARSTCVCGTREGFDKYWPRRDAYAQEIPAL